MHLAEFIPLVFLLIVAGVCRQFNLQTGYSGRNARKMGVKIPTVVLTSLPLLFLAIKRAPGAGGRQSLQKEVYS